MEFQCYIDLPVMGEKFGKKIAANQEAKLNKGMYQCIQ